MKTVDTYRWRYTERGRAKTATFHCTWDDIKDENPEAVPVEGSLIVRQEPEPGDAAFALASRGNAATCVAPRG